MKLAEFQSVMLKAKPGQHIRYHHGLLAASRETWKDVDRIANYVKALNELGIARLYQKREGEHMGYYVVLTERLKVRKDGQGSHQEAQRLMEIQ
jgi:hypothetical protein